MLDKTSDLLRDLEAKINIFSRNLSIPRIEKIILHIKSSLLSLKELVKGNTFNSIEDEILFFKTISPAFYAHWHYYTAVYNILMHITPGSRKYRVKYLQHELHKINDFFSDNVELYLYYRSGKSVSDREYFTRQPESDNSTDLLAPVIDNEVCTLYSFKYASIIANEKLEIYLNQLIQQQHDIAVQQDSTAKLDSLQWTESKTSLYELIYALYAGKVFNSGAATVELITRNFERMFLVELKAHTVAFQEILRRKKGLAFFLDWIRNKYILYAEAIDLKNRQYRRK